MAGLGQPAASRIPTTAGRGEGLSRPLARTTRQHHVPSPTQASSLSTCCSSCSLLLMDNGASNSFSSVSAPSITWVFVTAPARGSRKTYFLYLQRRGGGQEVRRSGICSRPVVWTTFPTSSGPPLVCTTASQALPGKTNWSGASWLPRCRLLRHPSLVPLAPH